MPGRIPPGHELTVNYLLIELIIELVKKRKSHQCSSEHGHGGHTRTASQEGIQWLDISHRDHEYSRNSDQQGTGCNPCIRILVAPINHADGEQEITCHTVVITHRLSHCLSHYLPSHSASSCAKVSSPIGPILRACAWNFFNEKSLPKRFFAFSRAAIHSRSPTLYEIACPGHPR